MRLSAEEIGTLVSCLQLLNDYRKVAHNSEVPWLDKAVIELQNFLIKHENPIASIDKEMVSSEKNEITYDENIVFEDCLEHIARYWYTAENEKLKEKIVENYHNMFGLRFKFTECGILSFGADTLPYKYMPREFIGDWDDSYINWKDHTLRRVFIHTEHILLIDILESVDVGEYKIKGLISESFKGGKTGIVNFFVRMPGFRGCLNLGLLKGETALFLMGDESGWMKREHFVVKHPVIEYGKGRYYAIRHGEELFENRIKPLGNVSEEITGLLRSRMRGDEKLFPFEEVNVLLREEAEKYK